MTWRLIKTKSVYDPVEESDGVRILLMRMWPRGIGYRKNGKRGMIDKWCKELGPSVELLDKWNKNKIAWNDYVSQYRLEQSTNSEAKADRHILTRMLTEDPDRTITLLCKEREDDRHCHRYILKDIMERDMPLA